MAKGRSKVPRSRMHNPEGGGYRKHTIVHSDKYKTLEDKIIGKGKVTLDDLKKLIEQNLEL